MTSFGFGFGLQPLAGRGGGFSPVSLFTDGEGGFIYNLPRTDLTWQDAGKTTPANDDGETVALAESLVNSIDATQGTAGSRPTRKTGGFIQFDGSADNLLTTFAAPLSFTLAINMKVTSASKMLMGSRTSANVDNCFIQTNASGFLCGGAAARPATIIASSVDIRGVTGIAVLTHQDGGADKLYWQGAEVFSGAASGSVSTGKAIALGGLNTNGTVSLFADMDLYQAFAINRVLTSDERTSLTGWMEAQSLGEP